VLNQREHQFSRLLTAEVYASAVVMLDTPCSEVVWRVLATHSIRQFPLHFPSSVSPCAITFQLESTATTSLSPVLVTRQAPPLPLLKFLLFCEIIQKWTRKNAFLLFYLLHNNWVFLRLTFCSALLPLPDLSR